jgi:hypothetical protein
MLINLTVDSMSKAAVRKVKSRANDLSEPSDIGRRYKCVMTKIGSYTMEDLVNFIEFGCIRMFDGVIDDDVAAIWESFRSAILYFLREKKVHGVKKKLHRAHKKLLEFARLLYARFGIHACKYNLHVLLCRLVDQEKVCGAIRQCTEYWIEMLVQWAKSSVRYRTTKFPEKVLSMDMCTDEGLHMAPARHPDASKPLLDLDGWVPEMRANQHRGLRLDTADDSGNLLLGNGKPLSRMRSTEQDWCTTALTYVVNEFHPIGWHEDVICEASITIYQYADTHSYENIYSRAYTRAWSRCSHYVWCRYTEPNGEVIDYIGDVHFYAKAQLPDGSEGEHLRVAVADLYKIRRVSRSIGTAWLCEMSGKPDIQSYGIRLGDVRGKMVMSRCDEPGHVQFLEYGTTSGTGRFGKGSAVEGEYEE